MDAESRRLTIIVESNGCWIVEQEMCGCFAHEKGGDKAGAEVEEGKHLEFAGV